MLCSVQKKVQFIHKVRHFNTVLNTTKNTTKDNFKSENKNVSAEYQAHSN